MAPEDKPTVLYIDDEVNNLASFKAAFRRVFDVITAESASEATEILATRDVHIIISDQRMPNMTGTAFFSSILAEYPDPVRMLLTGYADIQAVIDGINKGEVFRYFSKPWNDEEIIKNVQDAWEVYKLRQQNKALTEKLIDNNQKLEFLLRQQLLS